MVVAVVEEVSSCKRLSGLPFLSLLSLKYRQISEITRGNYIFNIVNQEILVAVASEVREGNPL